MAFKIGDKVVHPQHGVGSVVNLEEKNFGTKAAHRYYEVSIPGGSTVWVPVRSTSGLRKLATRDDIASCRMILEARPMALPEDARIRQSKLITQLNQGTIAAHCEVVRDLSAYSVNKSMIGNMGVFLRAIQEVLSQEWALVEDTTLPKAVYEITFLLEKGQSLKREVAANLSQMDR